VTHSLNRPEIVTYSDSTPDVTYTYDTGPYGIGRLRTVSNSTVTYTYTYDQMGAVVHRDQVIDGHTFSMSWTYNLAGTELFRGFSDHKSVKHGLGEIFGAENRS